MTGTGRNETNSRVRRAQGGEKKKAMCQRRDIRQVQSDNPPQGGGKAPATPTHKAAGGSQAASARGHHSAAQAASHSPHVVSVRGFRPQTHIPQQHWLLGETERGGGDRER